MPNFIKFFSLRWIWVVALWGGTSAFAGPLRAATLSDPAVTQAEMEQKDQWLQQTLLSQDHPVLSFSYGGIASGLLLPGWEKSPVRSETLDRNRIRHTWSWRDPRTALEVRVVAVEYTDYPALEWTAYFKNAGAAPTPVLEKIRGLDAGFPRATDTTTLRTIRGDFFQAASYEPLAYPLGEQPISFQPDGGRPTNRAWPYFNIDYGESGVLVALGWPGQWQGTFSRHLDTVSVDGGQETTHLRLRPGEEIRTPLTAVLFWQGTDWLAGQNLWRHWFLAHTIPHPSGQLPAAFTAVCSGNAGQSVANQERFLDLFVQAGLRPDYLWLDAGWYEGHPWYTAKGLGTWKPDPVRFPHGMRELSDHVHQQGSQLILWFEPERVYRGSDLWVQHPEWLIDWSDDHGYHKDLKLLNLGIPAAREWITRTISKFITDAGVDLYRQDFNLEPLPMWQRTDAADRQGMTENLYVQGYLTFWDTLLQQHPGLVIDSCASGGRRNDLETLRRSLPLLRSDYQAPNLAGMPTKVGVDVFDGNQGHTYGLSLWIPYFGTGVGGDDEYSARSHLCPMICTGVDPAHPNWPATRRQLADHRQVAAFWSGDYYPLTPYSSQTDVWIAWELVRPDASAGAIQAFRRELSPAAGTRLHLRGLEPTARYECSDLDSGKLGQFTGRELMDQGLAIYAAGPRTALILTFQKVP